MILGTSTFDLENNLQIVEKIVMQFVHLLDDVFYGNILRIKLAVLLKLKINERSRYIYWNVLFDGCNRYGYAESS